MKVLALIAATTILAAGLWLFVSEIRLLLNDPDADEAKSFSWRGRRRLAKLTRSEELVTDHEESRRAEVIARSTLNGLKRMSSPRYILAFSLFVIASLIGNASFLSVSWDGWGILILSAVMVFVSAQLWIGRIRRKIERTVEVNDWHVDLR